MQTRDIISKMLRGERRKEAAEIYNKIPYFLRRHLFAGIDNEPWMSVSAQCEQKDPEGIRKAGRMYLTILQTADKYCEEKERRNPDSDNYDLMAFAKMEIEKEFGDDAVRFVAEMAKLLNKEKELAFTFKKPQNAGQEQDLDQEDGSPSTQDNVLNQLEQLTQETDSLIHQAKTLVDDTQNYRRVTEVFLEEIRRDDVSLDEVTEDMSQFISHNTMEFQIITTNLQENLVKIANFKQIILNRLNEICERCRSCLEGLKDAVEKWMAAEARKSVRVGPETNTLYLLQQYNRIGKVLSKVLSWFSGNLQTLREEDYNIDQSDQNHHAFVISIAILEESFFSNFLPSLFHIIVVAQPKGVISIENKGGKHSPNYCTKKTQPFSTSIRVLGVESFPECCFVSKEVELVTEKDLKSGLNSTRREGQPFLKVEAQDEVSKLGEILFNIEVKNFSRVEQNNVYKQFLRLIYKVTVSIMGREFSLQTMSLPFTFNTGANQILEHMGARFWYLASAKDLYKNGFNCPDPLPVEEVIDMLDKRVTYLGNKKGRKLTDAEKDFLKGQLPASSDGHITMQGFLKDKMRALSEKPLAYSFYTWFYAVINSLESPLLLDAWQDGILYGFCSKRTTKAILSDPTMPDGAFILRPCVSEVTKTSSADAKAALTMEVKMTSIKGARELTSTDDNIESIPLFYKHIEKNLLYGAIKGIQYPDGTPVAKFLYGLNGGKKISILKQYSKKKKEFSTAGSEYKVLLKKVETMIISKNSSVDPVSEDMVDSGQGSTQRPAKRPRPSSQVASASSLSSVTTEPTPLRQRSTSTEVSQLNVQTSFHFPQGNPSSPPQASFTSGLTQSDRSGTQVQRTPAFCNNQSPILKVEETSQNGGLKQFGHVLVNVSQLSLVALSNAGNPVLGYDGMNGMSSPHMNSSLLQNRNFEFAADAQMSISNSSPANHSFQHLGLNNNNMINGGIAAPFQTTVPAMGLLNSVVQQQLPTTVTELSQAHPQPPRRRNNRQGNRLQVSGSARPQAHNNFNNNTHINTPLAAQLLPFNNIENGSFSFGQSNEVTNDSFLNNPQELIYEGANQIQLSPDSGVEDACVSPQSPWMSSSFSQPRDLHQESQKLYFQDGSTFTA